MKTNRTKPVMRERRVPSTDKKPTLRSVRDASRNAARYSTPELMPVAAALAELNAGELCALIEVTDNVPRCVPGLLAWVGHACDWELYRRGGVVFSLEPPDVAV